MIRLGTLDQQQLSAVLHRIENNQKTGKIVIDQNDVQEELYVYQGQVVTVIPVHPCEPLVRRLVHAGMISLNDLQKIPANIGKMISQAQEFSQYSDAQVATILMQLGLVHQEQLIIWVKQETAEALQELLIDAGGEIYFEENVQPPADCLYVLLTADTPEPALLSQAYDDGIMEERRQHPLTPLPILFKKSEPITDSKQFVPVTPSDSAQLPRVIRTTQDRIQRTVAAILPHPFADDGLTAKVAIPSTGNPLFRWEILLIIAVLLIAGLAHGINMFRYPYYEDDEGTYLSQAWAVLHLGRLAYYTYWYDHAPAGWIQIALWTAITGGFHTFGSAITSGRIFAFLMQIASTFMVYRIARCTSRNILVAVIAALLFALSPYGIYFHRRILLDNICTFWMLLSILLLVSRRLSLNRVWLSALTLGISILSKEVTFFLVPIMAYLVFYRSDKSHRWFATIGWLALVVSIVSLYPLMAILNNEMFPTGTLLGGTKPHVSMLGSIQYQGSRTIDGGLFNPNSRIRTRAAIWIMDDPVITVVGIICAILSVLVIKKRRLIGVMGLVTLSLVAFLIRGGEVLDFYLIPLLPLLALNIGLFIGFLGEILRIGIGRYINAKSTTGRFVEYSVVILCIFGMVLGYSNPGAGIGFGNTNLSDRNNPLIYWNGRQADTQSQATQWVVDHISHNSRIIIDEYMWQDLHDDGYNVVHYYWKIILDPAIGGSVFHNDWHNFDYIITTPQMLDDIKIANLTILKTALAHSVPVAHFQVGKYVVEIHKINKG